MKNKDGNTPLHLCDDEAAIIFANIAPEKMLETIKMKNKNGQTPVNSKAKLQIFTQTALKLKDYEAVLDLYRIDPQEVKRIFNYY